MLSLWETEFSVAHEETLWFLPLSRVPLHFANNYASVVTFHHFFVEVDISISVSHIREGQDIPRLVEANLIGSCQRKSRNADGDGDLNLYTAWLSTIL